MVPSDPPHPPKPAWTLLRIQAILYPLGDAVASAMAARTRVDFTIQVCTGAVHGYKHALHAVPMWTMPGACTFHASGADTGVP